MISAGLRDSVSGGNASARDSTVVGKLDFNVPFATTASADTATARSTAAATKAHEEYNAGARKENRDSVVSLGLYDADGFLRSPAVQERERQVVTTSWRM
jgi:hypothetical protein